MCKPSIALYYSSCCCWSLFLCVSAASLILFSIFVLLFIFGCFCCCYCCCCRSFFLLSPHKVFVYVYVHFMVYSATSSGVTLKIESLTILKRFYEWRKKRSQNTDLRWIEWKNELLETLLLLLLSFISHSNIVCLWYLGFLVAKSAVKLLLLLISSSQHTQKTGTFSTPAPIFLCMIYIFVQCSTSHTAKELLPVPVSALPFICVWMLACVWPYIHFIPIVSSIAVSMTQCNIDNVYNSGVYMFVYIWIFIYST